MTKLAIICAPGLDSFLQWAAYLPDEYETRVFPCNSIPEIEAAIKWGDVLWFEWANEIAVTGTANSSGKPTIVRLHSYEAFSGMPGRIEWRTVNSLVYVAEHVREIAERHSFIPPHVRRHIIPNGVDLDRTPDHNPGPGNMIAVVGGISHKKTPELVLQVAALLPDAYRLHWAGAIQDARYSAYLMHMVKSMGLEERVRLYGHVADMEAFWEGKNYLLHTSVHEGHSLAILEAMARNIQPVIHNYYGADRQYPGHILFNTCQEAAHMLQENYIPGVSRRYLEERGWTLQNQAAQIERAIRKAVS